MTTLPTAQIYVENPKVVEVIRVNDDTQDSITAVLSFSTPGTISYNEKTRVFSIRNFEQTNKLQSIVFLDENIKGHAVSGEYFVRRPDGFLFAVSNEYLHGKYVHAKKLSSDPEGSVDTSLAQRRNQSRRR